jgi:hypothetical protein
MLWKRPSCRSANSCRWTRPFRSWRSHCLRSSCATSPETSSDHCLPNWDGRRRPAPPNSTGTRRARFQAKKIRRRRRVELGERTAPAYGPSGRVMRREKEKAHRKGRKASAEPSNALSCSHAILERISLLRHPRERARRHRHAREPRGHHSRVRPHGVLPRDAAVSARLLRCCPARDALDKSS